MNDDEFKIYVLERLDRIEKRLSRIEQDIATIKTNWRWVKGILAALATIASGLGSFIIYIRNKL